MKNIYAVKYIKTAAAIPFLAGYLIAGTAYSLPCNGESVVRGETMMEVSAKCGETEFVRFTDCGSGAHKGIENRQS